MKDKIDFAPLAKSIKTLVEASTELEEEAAHQVKKLHKLLPFPRHHATWRSLFQSCARTFARSNDEEEEGIRIPHLPDFKKIKKTLAKIHEINKKLQNFEGGFISEEGIKDREWYKHKGVAPGAWLGYGATTVSPRDDRPLSSKLIFSSQL